LNAPRQGLFASLLIVSFALHTFLLVIATTHQLNENRASQGQLMTSQLVADSLSELEPANTVSLALVANRYATNPSVASIRILDANKQVLATSGMAKRVKVKSLFEMHYKMKRKLERLKLRLSNQVLVKFYARSGWRFWHLFIHGLIGWRIVPLHVQHVVNI
jgi:hypothetical protein